MNTDHVSDHVKNDITRQAVTLAMDAIQRTVTLIYREGTPDYHIQTMRCASGIMSCVAGLLIANSPMNPASMIDKLLVMVKRDMEAAAEVVEHEMKDVGSELPMCFVVAETESEVLDYATRVGLRHNRFKHVHRVADLLGQDRCLYVTIGQYWKLPEWPAMKIELANRASCGFAKEIKDVPKL